jgi:hypothetical protein
MSKPNAQFAVPLGDRDEAPPSEASVGRPEPASPTEAERKPPPLVPELDLHLPSLEQALHETSIALCDLQIARARNDRPLFASAANRLARHGEALRAITSHVGKAVKAARSREHCHPQRSEAS